MSFIDILIKEWNKKEIQDKIRSDVLNPILWHICRYFFIFIVIVFILFLITFILLSRISVKSS